MKRILFVCMGNICRSPTAEALFRHHLRQAQIQYPALRTVQHDSCGTHDYHVGAPPDARAISHAMRRGIDMADLRARQIKPDDFESFDVILAADEQNLLLLRQLCPDEYRHKLQLMLDWVPGQQGEAVPDPYYGGAEGFETVLDLLDDVAKQLVLHLQKQG